MGGDGSQKSGDIGPKIDGARTVRELRRVKSRAGSGSQVSNIGLSDTQTGGGSTNQVASSYVIQGGTPEDCKFFQGKP